MPQAVCQGPVTHMTCGMWPVTYIACIVCRNHSADNSCSMSHIGGHALSAGCVGFVRHYCKRRVCACACAFVRMCVSIYLSIYLSIFLSLCLSVSLCFLVFSSAVWIAVSKEGGRTCKWDNASNFPSRAKHMINDSGACCRKAARAL